MKQAFRLLLMWLLIHPNHQLHAHSPCTNVLKGKVISAADQTPIPYAVVLLEELNRSTTCDEKGQFSFDKLCTGKFNLKVAHLSFSPFKQTVEVNENSNLLIQLNAQSEQLKTVEVLERKGVGQSFLPMAELSGERLRQTNGLTLGECLKAIPGVNSLQTGGTISKPVIHGLHSQRILMLNNGVRQEGQQWGAEHAPEIDPLVAGKLVVVKGAGSVRYGSDAIAGVILVEPRPLADSAGTRGEIVLVGNTNGRGGASSAYVEHTFPRLKPLSFRLQGTFKQAGSLSAPTYNLANTGVKEYNFSYAIGWKKPLYGADVFYSQFNTTLGILGPSHLGNLTDLRNALKSSVPAETGDFSYLIRRPYQTVSHELVTARAWWKTSKRGKLMAQYGRQYNLRSEFDKHRSLSDSLAGVENPELQFEITTHTGEVVLEHGFLKKGSGAVGVSGMYQKNTYNGRALIPNFINQGVGLFIMEKYPVGPFTIEVGGRFDVRDLQVFRYAFVPGVGNVLQRPTHSFQGFAGNAGILYQRDTTWQVSLHAGTAWRPPSVNELYSFGLHHGAAAMEYGDANLGTERTLNYIASVRSNAVRNLSIDVSAYLHDMRNFIYRRPMSQPVVTIRGAFPSFFYAQTHALLRGCDVSAAYRIHSRVQIGAKASWLRAWDKTAREWLIFMPSDRYEAEATYRFKSLGIMRSSSATFSWTYVTRQNRVPGNLDFASPPAAYHLLNLHLACTLTAWNRPIELGFSVYNIANVRYRDYLDRFRYFVDAMGRNMTLRLAIPLHRQP